MQAKQKEWLQSAESDLEMKVSKFGHQQASVMQDCKSQIQPLRAEHWIDHK